MRRMSPKDLERSPTNPALSATFEGNYSSSKEDGLAKGSFRTGFEPAGFDEARNERRWGMRRMSPKDLERSPTNPALGCTYQLKSMRPIVIAGSTRVPCVAYLRRSAAWFQSNFS